MNSEEFKTAIKLKRPRYANSRIPVIKAFANKGKSKSEYSQFGPVYELYIFAFVLGLKKNLKLPLPTRKLTTDFIEIGKWKRDSSLVDFLLMIIFSHCEEIGFDWNDLEDMEEKELNEVISGIIDFIESYANGGLEFLQQEWQEDNLINSPYLFVDLLAEHSVFRKKDEDRTGLDAEEATDDIVFSTKKLIDKGESPTVELKSTLRVNLHTNNPDDKMELACMKTIAGFMNTKDGTLLIGVADNKEVLGLKTDFDSFSKKDKLDEFQKHLDNLIEKYLGNAAYSAIELMFPEIDGQMICRMDISFRVNGPTYLNNKSKNTQEFYIRRAASTKDLSLSEANKYINNIWK
jgi:hypothetical protein